MTTGPDIVASSRAATEEELDPVFNKVLDENNAQEVFKKLEEQDNARLTLLSRWVWELIQNARGTVGSQEALQIEITLGDDDLVFRHNGARFRDVEVAHLILHGSSKQDRGDIGKFGTGFIATHLISRRVRVRGSLLDGRPFDFWLNREGASWQELQLAMKNSRKEFYASVGRGVEAVPDPFTTEYTYPVSPEVKEVVAQGLKELAGSAAYVFAFNSMLRRLRLLSSGRTIEITADRLEPVSVDTQRMGLRTGSDKPTLWVISVAKDDVAATVVVDAAKEAPTIVLPRETPRLFLAFPLSGTQTLCIPLVLNSEKFEPRPERDGIYLGVGTTAANKENMALFSRGCRHIVALATLAAREAWVDASMLNQIRGLEHHPWADHNWLQTEVRSVLIQGLREAKSLRTISGSRVSPEAAWIPVKEGEASSLEVWSATEQLLVAADRLPQRSDQEAWALAVDSWIPFFALTNEQIGERWSVLRLADHLAGLLSVAGVKGALKAEQDPLSWINSVHMVICSAGQFECLTQKPLTPNQAGDLVPLGKLYRDGGIDAELKDIGGLIGVPVREVLLHPGITTPKVVGSLKVRTEEEVVALLIETIRSSVNKGTADDSLWNANVRLFSWLLRRGEAEKLDSYPMTSIPDSAGKRTVLVLRRSTKAQDRPLAPVAIWPEPARHYVDLLPESAVLNDSYAEAVSEPDLWEKLAIEGFVHLGPLYEAESVVSEFLPDEPLNDSEQKSRPRSEEMRVRSEMAWLSGTDRSIIDRARSSQGRAIRLLQFCFDYAVVADTKAFDVESVRCDNDSEHRYYRANWLGPLKTRRWIPLERGSHDTPSPESLAKLLQGEQQMLKRLSDERVTTLLRVLGVKAPALILESVGRDDEERMALIQSLAVITTAANNDAAKVQAFATAVQKDPAVIGLVQERQERIDRVARNQKFGDLIERLFKEAMAGGDLSVRRTGAGHDYRVLEKPVGEEDDAGGIEIAGEKASVFVEIKATKSTDVRMSVRQVKEAVRNKNGYFLCVVATSDSEIDVDAFKRQVRFVIDIGTRLERLWGEYASMEDMLRSVDKTDQGLLLEVTGHDARFCVNQGVWRDGLDFPAAVALFRSKVLTKPL